MNIKELIDAIDKSNMETEAKAETIEILEDWEDKNVPDYQIEIWDNHNPKNKDKYPFTVEVIRESESTTVATCVSYEQAEKIKKEWEEMRKDEIREMMQDKWSEDFHFQRKTKP